MSRAKIDPAAAAESGGLLFTPELQEEPGLAGPWSTLPVAEPDPRVRAELARILDAARAIRPTLRAQQQETEERGHYSQEVHEYFLEHGFYRVLTPQVYGGLELGVSAYFSMISEVARGCPSTAWCLALPVAHNLTLASYWPEQVQREVFGQNGFVIGPASGNPAQARTRRVDGGYLISGTWRYASGSPYSNYFFPTITVPASGDEDEYLAWAIIPREQYEVMDDWGRVIGMKGSGSNGIEIAEEVFVPEAYVCRQDWGTDVSKPTVGYEIHGNPTYSGVFFGFAEGEVAAVSAGLGYAAIDEYERIIRTTKAPFREIEGLRAQFEDWRRVLGMAYARVDAANAALLRLGKQYEEFGRQVATGEAVFDAGRSMRMNNAYFVVEELVWEALQELIRTAGTGYSADGQRMQRYFRDIWATVSRTDQFQFFAAPAMAFHFDGAPAVGE